MQLGMVHFNQMLSPQRDQTETREAIKEFQTFVDRYPNSPLAAAGETAAARGEGPAVGRGPVRSRTSTPAFGLTQRPTCDTGTSSQPTPNTPEKTHCTSAWRKPSKSPTRPAEALPYYERLLSEFEKSEYPRGGKTARRPAQARVESRRPRQSGNPRQNLAETVAKSDKKDETLSELPLHARQGDNSNLFKDFCMPYRMLACALSVSLIAVPALAQTPPAPSADTRTRGAAGVGVQRRGVRARARARQAR